MSICYNNSIWIFKTVKMGLLEHDDLFYIIFCISATQITKYSSQPFIGNAVYAAIAIIYTIYNRKYFIKYNKFE